MGFAQGSIQALDCEHEQEEPIGSCPGARPICHLGCHEKCQTCVGTPGGVLREGVRGHDGPRPGSWLRRRWGTPYVEGGGPVE